MSTVAAAPDTITALILAGGRSRRMASQAKALLPFLQRPLISHVIDRLLPQAAGLIISANENLDRYGRFGWPVISDSLSDWQGPLAGILAALEQCPTPYLLTAPCDAPLVPRDLGERLSTALNDAHARVAVAHDGQRLQPLFSLLHRDCAAGLRGYLEGGERKAMAWITARDPAIADFSDRADAFMNLNTPEQFRAAEKMLRSGL